MIGTMFYPACILASTMATSMYLWYKKPGIYVRYLMRYATLYIDTICMKLTTHPLNIPSRNPSREKISLGISSVLSNWAAPMSQSLMVLSFEKQIILSYHFASDIYAKILSQHNCFYMENNIMFSLKIGAKIFFLRKNVHLPRLSTSHC